MMIAENTEITRLAIVSGIILVSFGRKKDRVKRYTGKWYI
jgi:hypothetical protein